MKKVIALFFVLFAFTFSDLNAQSCCKAKQECKPKQCCPVETSCCAKTKVIEGSVSTEPKAHSAPQQAIKTKEPRIKEEEKKVDLKKV